MHTIAIWIGSIELPQVLGYVVIGAILMILDRFFGVAAYRWYYNRGNTAEHTMPEGAMGWLYEQPLRHQHNRAMALSAIFTALTLMFGTFSVWEKIGECVGFVFEGWAMLPGFWIGNLVYDKVLMRQDKIFHAIDNRQEIINGLRASVKNFFGGILSSARSQSVPSETTSTQPPAPPEPPKRMSASDILQRRADGRKL